MHPAVDMVIDPQTPVRPLSAVRDDLAYDRTHLASERTYASWLRTGLSVAAGGIAVARLVPNETRGAFVSLGLGGVFVLLGIGIIAYGTRGFAVTTERLCRERSRPLPTSPRAAYVLTLLIAILLVAVLAFLWSHRGRSAPVLAAPAAAGVGDPP